MVGKQYLARQVATLLRFAKSVTNAELSAILVDRASDLKSQLDLVPAVPDRGLSAPDVQIDPGSDLTSQAQRTPSAIEVIVQNYIRLNDRQALESLRKHREDLAAHLSEGKDGSFDYRALVQQIEDELAVIGTGLAKLNSAGEA
jgi:hypothetical protein